MIRSHELCRNGSTRLFQNCITIFSSTNYCNGKNNGAIGFVNGNCQVQIHPTFCLTLDQKIRRRVMIPEWLISTMFDSQSSTSFEFEEEDFDLKIFL